MKRNQTPSALLTVIALSLAAAGGCTKAQPERTMQVSNNEYQLDELFTDPRGYTIYRFYDSGDYRYYVVGPNGAQMLPTTKTVTQPVTTPSTVVVAGHNHGK